MSANKKKVIVLCAMVLLLVVTGTLNFFLNKKLPPSQGDNGGDGNAVTTFFSNYRANRESTRAQEIAYLDAIIKSEASSAEAKADAETQKKLICENMETELILEGLIKAKGYSDAVVTLSTSNCNIIINDSALTSEKVAQVVGVITEETGYKPTQIAITPYGA